MSSFACRRGRPPRTHYKVYDCPHIYTTIVGRLQGKYNKDKLLILVLVIDTYSDLFSTTSKLLSYFIYFIGRHTYRLTYLISSHHFSEQDVVDVTRRLRSRMPTVSRTRSVVDVSCRLIPTQFPQVPLTFPL